MQPVKQLLEKTPSVKSGDFLLLAYPKNAQKTSEFSRLPHRALSDFVLLIAIDKYDSEYLYLIPSFAVDSIKYIAIKNPVVYNGMYAKYRISGQVSLVASQEIALL